MHPRKLAARQVVYASTGEMVQIALFYGLIHSGWIDALGLAGGFGALPLGIVLAGSFGSKEDSSFQAAPMGTTSRD